MVDAVVTVVIEKLAAVIEAEARLLGGVREELEYIRDELRTMNAFLEDAEEEDQAERAKIKTEWVKRVRELAYDAEDCIDEFNLRLQKPLREGLVGRFLVGAQYVRSLRARRWIANEIQRIKSRAKEASERAQRYGFTSVNGPTRGSSSGARQHNSRQDALFLTEEDVVGIEKPRKKLVDWLLQESEPQLVVISVVGAGGLGKTTLVRRVYESSRVNAGHFAYRAWITISESFNRSEFFKNTFIKMYPNSRRDADNMDEVKLVEKIRDHLKEKRYVIVFDDVWTKDAWQSIKLVLPDDNNGSRVLVTTRIEQVAYTCSSLNHNYVHRHKPLSPEQSKELLCRRVFNDSSQSCPPDHLFDIMGKVLKKCAGLPLAIVTIGGLLASKRNKYDIVTWQSLGLELETSSTLNQVLALSYKDLCYHLRKCLLYLSIFPEDYVINRNRLQRLWIAEGFIAPCRDMTAEDVAESYFDELISRSVILPANINFMGKVAACQVHDMMLDFLISKSVEENLVCISGDRITPLPTDAVRRLSIQTERDSKHFSADNVSLFHTRSLAMFNSAPKSFLTPAMKLLRVLDLEGLWDLDNHHVTVLGEFVHLKYLSLRNTIVHELPASFGKLQSLETFDFRGGYLQNIPIGIMNLKKLEYILGGDYFHFIKLPRGIETLTNLKRVTNLHLDRTKGLAKELGKLTQLRKLSVAFTTRETGAEFCASLSKLSSCLRSLKVFYSDEHSSTMVQITLPPPLLESLGFNGKLGALPRWVAMLPNLVKLSLRRTKLGEAAVQAIGDLPNLLKLSLGEYSFDENKFRFVGNGFGCLKVLSFDWVMLKLLMFEAGAMPKLELIEMNWCRFNVEGADFGVEHLASLKDVRLSSIEQRVVNMLKLAVQAHPKNPRFTSKETR